MLLEGPELISRCYEVEKIAEAARNRCIKPLELLADTKSNGRPLIYTFKERVKAPSGIYSKVMRKRRNAPTPDHDDAGYGPDHMTDTWACRYVTLFQNDIEPMVEKLLRLVRHMDVDHEDGSKLPSPFVKDGLFEAIVYTNRPANDPLAITQKIKDLLLRYGFADKIGKQPENKKSGYSSIHLIVKVPVRHKPVDGGRESEKIALIEVQFRDIFEEGWGEIQHRLVYGGKDGGGAGQATDDDAWWRPHLNALKTFADGCSQHASIIERNSVTLQPQKRDADTRSVSQPDVDLGLVLAAVSDAPKKVRRTIEYAYQRLLDFQEPDTKPTLIDYVELADAFKMALKAADDKLDRPTRNGRSVRYHLMMEYAIALQNTQEIGIPDEVIPIFELIESQFPDDATVYYRHSRAISRIAKEKSDWILALDLLIRANEVLQRDNTVDKTSSFRIAIPIQIGFVHWALFHHLGGEPDGLDERRQHLEVAISETTRARKLAEELVGELGMERYIDRYSFALANLLYYYYERELFQVEGGGDAVRRRGPTWNQEEIDALLLALRTPPLAEQSSRDLNTRDTLMCIYYILGNAKEVSELANLNMEDLMDRARLRAQRRDLSPLDVETFLTRSAEREIYKKALDMGKWARQNLGNLDAQT